MCYASRQRVQGQSTNGHDRRRVTACRCDYVETEMTAFMHGWDTRDSRAGGGHAGSGEREEGMQVLVRSKKLREESKSIARKGDTAAESRWLRAHQTTTALQGAVLRRRKDTAIVRWTLYYNQYEVGSWTNDNYTALFYWIKLDFEWSGVVFAKKKNLKCGGLNLR